MVTATQLLHRLTSLEPYDPDREWDPPVDDPRVLQNLRANDLDRLPWFYKQYTERLPRVTLPRELPATIAAAVDVLAGTADVPHADLSLAHLSRLLHLCGDTFAAALNQAAAAHLRGPVTKLTPHVLRHACASRLCGEGIGPTAIQQLLGHRWLSTTVRYVHVANEAIESGALEYSIGSLKGLGSQGAVVPVSVPGQLPDEIGDGRAGRRPGQGAEACNGTCGWPPPSGASGGPPTCGGRWPTRAWRSRPGRCRICGRGGRHS